MRVRGPVGKELAREFRDMVEGDYGGALSDMR